MELRITKFKVLHQINIYLWFSLVYLYKYIYMTYDCQEMKNFDCAL